MRNWFAEIPGLRQEGKLNELPSLDTLKPFQEFLGRSRQECLVIAWLCVNHKSRDESILSQLFEKLGELLDYREIAEALVELMADGWVQVSSEDFSESQYNVFFTHRVEVALRTGDNSIFGQLGKSTERYDRSILRLHAHAVLFSAKITAVDKWIQTGDAFISLSDHAFAEVIRSAKMDGFTQSIVLFIFVMHAVEGSRTEWRPLSELFSDNRLVARRLLDQWKNPSWKPISAGLLQMAQFPMGPTVLFPSESIQRKIYGLADDRQSVDSHLPSTLQRISAPTISKRNLYYNPAEAEQIELLERMLKPAAFKKYQRTAIEQGDAPGLTVLLAGGPGTGKTELARQLAKKTGRDLLLFNAAEQRDKFYGESEKRIQRVFDTYAGLVRSHRQIPILFFNEGDSVFQSRQNRDSSTSGSENTVQTILLNELERFHGILICTTNRPDSFDEAFGRRFLIQITIHPPLPAVRLQLLRHLFPDLPIAAAETLAADHAFTAADLENFRKLRCMQSIVHLDQATPAQALHQHLQGLKKDKTAAIGFKI